MLLHHKLKWTLHNELWEKERRKRVYTYALVKGNVTRGATTCKELPTVENSRPNNKEEEEEEEEENDLGE